MRGRLERRPASHLSLGRAWQGSVPPHTTLLLLETEQGLSGAGAGPSPLLSQALSPEPTVHVARTNPGQTLSPLSKAWMAGDKRGLLVAKSFSKLAGSTCSGTPQPGAAPSSSSSLCPCWGEGQLCVASSQSRPLRPRKGLPGCQVPVGDWHLQTLKMTFSLQERKETSTRLEGRVGVGCRPQRSAERRPASALTRATLGLGGTVWSPPAVTRECVGFWHSKLSESVQPMVTLGSHFQTWPRFCPHSPVPLYLSLSGGRWSTDSGGFLKAIH